MSRTSVLAAVPLLAALCAAVPSAEAAAPCGRRLVGATPAEGELVAPCRRSPAALERSHVPSPVIEGPVSGGRGMPTVSGTAFDLAEIGYVRSEYFLDGTARSYRNAAPLGSNGRWRVEEAETAPYRTRIVVYQPEDPGRFSGTVAVEWLNVSGGLDAAPDWITIHTELTRTGAAWVGVSAQFIGVEAGASPLTPLAGGLKSIDPERYGSLSHPGDSFSYDIFTQAGQALLAPRGPDPLGGRTIRKLIAVGESQSAFRLVTYVNAIDPLVRVYDGFFIHSRGGSAAPLSQEPQQRIAAPDVARIRTDVRVPVLTFQTETDLLELGFLPDRQPDGRNLRLWEAAGTAHADTYTLIAGFSDLGGDPSVAEVVVSSAPIPGILDCGSPVNSGPQHWVAKAAFRALETWVGGGPAPARAPRLEVAGDELVLDEHGNARGGIRTSYVEAPTAVLSGSGQVGSGFCFIFGTTVPFSDAKLRELYPSNAEYVRQVAQANDRAVRAGFLLREDADLIEAWAAQSGIGG